MDELTEDLLALMLLSDARRPARTDDDGHSVPLDEQDRTRWDRGRIAEGRALLDTAIASRAVGGGGKRFSQPTLLLHSGTNDC